MSQVAPLLNTSADRAPRASGDEPDKCYQSHLADACSPRQRG